MKSADLTTEVERTHEENIFSKFENFWRRLQKEKIKSQEKYSDFNVREKLASKLNRKLAENNMTDTQKVSYSWIFTRKMRRRTLSLFWKLGVMLGQFRNPMIHINKFSLVRLSFSLTFHWLIETCVGLLYRFIVRRCVIVVRIRITNYLVSHLSMSLVKIWFQVLNLRKLVKKIHFWTWRFRFTKWPKTDQ